MVVIDAVPYVKCSKGKLTTLPLSKPGIQEIAVLEGEKAVPLYGEQAENGLVLITSKSYEENKSN